MTVRRALTIAIALLLAGQGAALAGHNDPSPHVAAMGRAAPPTSSSTTSTEAPVTTTSPTTTEVPPATTAAPRPVTTRPKTTTPRKPAAAPAPPPPPPAPNPGSIAAAFYYGWYPSSFSNPGTHYHPTAGQYDSNDLGTVKRQIDEMRYGGMQAAIASWWGPATWPNNPYGYQTVDRAFGVDLQAAHGTPFQWALYFESGAPAFADRSPAVLQSATQYIAAHYANDPNYLHIAGRPVIFVWPNAGDGCDMVQRWHDVAPGFYVVQKRFPNFQACAGQADSWHEYSPNLSQTEVKPWSFSVSAGFWRYDESTPRLARDPARYDGAVRAMAASTAQWKLVTTFNEWGEGTAVEPAAEWATASGYGVYLDILHKYLGSR